MTDTAENQAKMRERLVRALREIERLRGKLDELEGAAAEPIAVVGIGLRLPGRVDDLDSLWSLLESRTDAVAPIPATRWDADAIYDPDPEAVDKSYVREAGLIEQVDGFDPGFFNISPREAKSIDPQHRLLLETAWEALESAGIVPASLVNSKTGVFVGIGPSDYQRYDDASAYSVMGTHMSFAAGRVAFTLGLQGPALSVDTACSASLVALHLACNSLRVRECSLALTAGVQALIDPHGFVVLSRTRAVAPDGRCKTFSANADGYGRGEGVVTLALERLSDAQKHGRDILAVIRGSAVNHDGASSGITAPNGSSQQKVLRSALADAHLTPIDIDVVECHGTGTKLGDPIEIQALAAVYGKGRPAERPLLLGALKTNIGHLEAASGIAGVAKIIAAMRHRALPATLHSTPRNPHVEWSELPIDVVDEQRPWPRGPADAPRRAGVSAFGLSGTNAHVILEEAPLASANEDEQARRVQQPPALPVLLSGRSASALAGQAQALREHIVANPNISILDLAASLATTRSHFEHRAGLIVRDTTELLAKLATLDSNAAAQRRAEAAPKLAIQFTGQGSQRLGMGRELHTSFPVFRAAFDEICTSFDAHLDAPLRDTIFADADPIARIDRIEQIDQTAFTQPALFAFEVALYRLFESWGVKPELLLGHSIGELVAAHVAGVFSLADACRLVAARGRLMQALPEGGTMVSVQASEDEVSAVLAQHPGVDIAGLNGPLSTVLSGDEAATLAAAAVFEARGRKTSRLRVSHAFHSHRMDPMLAEFREVAERVRYLRPSIPIVSNVTGALADVSQICTAEYWVRHVRAAVRFVDGVATLEQLGVGLLLELGPHGVLSSMASACLSADSSMVVLPSLRKDQPELELTLDALAKLHAHGVVVDWEALFGPYAPKRISLPTYAFARQRHWLEPTERRAQTRARATAGAYPLSGERVDLGNGLVLHTVDIGPGVQSYLGDHVVYDRIVVPGAFYLGVLLAVAESHWPGQPLELRNVEFIRALTFEHASDDVPLYVELVPLGGATPGFSATMFTVERGARIERALAELSPAHNPAEFHTAPPVSRPAFEHTDFSNFDNLLRAIKIQWGPKWWWLRHAASLSRGSAIGRLEAADDVPLDDAPIPGGFMDNSFALAPWAHDNIETEDGTPQLPFSVERLVWYGHARPPVYAQLTSVETGVESNTSSIIYWDVQGTPLGHIENYTARRAPLERFIRSSPQQLYVVDWRELPVSPSSRGPWVVVGEDSLGLAKAPDVRVLPDLDALLTSLDTDAPPDVLIVPCLAEPSDPLAASSDLLVLLKRWLAEDRLAQTGLLLITRGAVAVAANDELTDLARAPLWGLVRTAQTEHPDRALTIVDVDAGIIDLDDPVPAIAAALASGEPQLAIRAGSLWLPRIAAVRSRPQFELPDSSAWRLDFSAKGSIDNLRLAENPAALEPLRPGQVRVAPRVGGLNFRDVLNVLGMYPGDAGPLGGEASGVVIEAAPGSRFKPGDRVTGMFARAFANLAIANEHWLLAIPPELSFADAATLPAVYLTAYYGLKILGRLAPGERVLIHAAAGGVGIAAVHLARHFGAEVFATANPSKWDTLRRLGLSDDHIASSRTLEFETKFAAATGGQGIDVVLNSLAKEFLDASLRLLPRGGRFLEMGKTDLRDPAVVAAQHPGVRYLPYDILDIPDDQVREIYAALEQLLAHGGAEPLPHTCFDVRQAPQAFRHMAKARHVGKILLTIPQPLDPAKTVLITGGTGALGSLLAEHLVAAHGVRQLLLTSRSGTAASGAEQLRARLAAAGAVVTIAACDAADRDALADLLASIPSEHPLGAVFHTAGVLDDGTLVSLTTERLAGVYRPKVEAARHLHELTASLDLSAFVLFSSLSGSLGTAGQANYAAANAWLDALATHRRALGLPATSLAWGPWAEGGMAARLSDADVARMKRAGIPPLSSQAGLALLDAALARPEAMLLPVLLDTKALASRSHDLPRLLSGLVRAAAKRTSSAAAAGNLTLAQRLAAISEDERLRVLVDLIRTEAAAVLGLSTPQALALDEALQELGLDSLMAIELRNRLQAVTALRLPSTLLFDYPTVTKLARMLLEQLGEALGQAPRLEQRPPTRQVSGPDSDAIAIVSMACRYPGDIESPEHLWQLLADGHDAIGPFPQTRGWDLDALYHPDPDHAGTTYTRAGGFLSHPELFDSRLFAVSPREATMMDPQHRLLLELAWETIERARSSPRALEGTRTGVYVGICYDDYKTLAPSGYVAEDGYVVLGNAASIASGRIAYSLGLEGPAVTVDTACSSSLVALHLAAQALRNGECDFALVGGATIFATAEPLLLFSRLKTISPDGRCKAFSEEADGAGWSEGAGMLLLARLADAIAAELPVLALVRGSAINQDGRSQGLTAPNGPSQQRIIRAALEAAKLSAADVDVVEAHGTGTRLGDPIEVQALIATYGREHRKESPLWLGTVKSNFGHTQAAAGVAGVMKMVLALQHELLPRSLHAAKLSSQVDWSEQTVQVLSDNRSWPRELRPRRAAVSSFGISGTNAHVILEEAPVIEPVLPVREAPPPAHLPLLLSGKNDGAVREQAARIRVLERPLLDVAYSLVSTRASLDRRAVSVVGELARLDAGQLEIVTAKSPKLAVLFTGQGAQRVGMGRELAEAYPTFRHALEQIFALFDPQLAVPLRGVMFGERSEPGKLLDQTAFSQPALFALEVALFQQLSAWGVEPDVLLGHSIGELAAAHVAGVFSLQDACKLVAARGRLMQALPEGGSMLSIQAAEHEVLPLLAEHPGVDIAGLNGPLSVVVSGDEQPVAALEAHFAQLGRKTRRLTVSHAFHSHRMDPMLDDFRKVAAAIEFSPPKLPIVSNVTGRIATADELMSPEYWARHVRQAVRFLDGIRTLEAQGVGICLELGPHGVLTAMAVECLSEAAQEHVALVPALRRDRPETETIAMAVGALHCHGVAVDWQAYFRPFGARPVELPTYPFQRGRYWLDTTTQQRLPAEPARAEPLRAEGNASDDFLPRLRSVPESERRQYVVTRVLEIATAVLGANAAEPLTASSRFSDYGLDSLMAVELRNRLQRLTGLRLPNTAAYDNPTPALLAEQLEQLLAASAAEPIVHERDTAAGMLEMWSVGDKPSVRPQPSIARTGGGVLEMVRHAISKGAVEAALATIQTLIELRRKIDDLQQPEPRPKLLASAPAPMPVFYCIPSPALPSSPLQFARFAASFAGQATVWATANPGYELTDALPDSPETIVRHHVDGIAMCLGEQRPILVGYSGGGFLATDVAHRLEQLGRPAAGLVLLDPVTETGKFGINAELGFIARAIDALGGPQPIHSDEEVLVQVLAMVATFSLYLSRWEAPRLQTTPTLFIHALGGLPALLEGSERMASTPQAHFAPNIAGLTISNVHADHFQLIGQTIVETVAAIREWMDSPR